LLKIDRGLAANGEARAGVEAAAAYELPVLLEVLPGCAQAEDHI
jgi:hypothetical protein